MQVSFGSPFIAALRWVESTLRLQSLVCSKCIAYRRAEFADRNVTFVVFVHEACQVVNVVLREHLQATYAHLESAQVD